MKYKNYIICSLSFCLLFVLSCTHNKNNSYKSSEYKIAENDKENINSSATVSGQIFNMNDQPVIAEIQLHSGKVHSPFQYSTIRTYPTDKDGKFSFEIPAPYNGFRLIVLKGCEYEYVEIPFDVQESKNTTINVKIARIIDDLTIRGWYSGDGHQHSSRPLGSDGSDPVDQVALQNIASGNSWGVLSEHRHMNSTEAFFSITKSLPTDFSGNGGIFFPLKGYEWTAADRDAQGHMNVFGAGSELLLSSDFNNEPNTEKRNAEHARRILEFQGAGAFVQANHPMNPTLRFMREVGYDRAWFLDAFEVWNAGEGTIALTPYEEDIREQISYGTKPFTEWFKLLNMGARMPATATSDSHTLDVTKNRTVAAMGDFFAKLVNFDGSFNEAFYDREGFETLWSLIGGTDVGVEIDKIAPASRIIYSERVLESLKNLTKTEAKDVLKKAFDGNITQRIAVLIGFFQGGLASGNTKTYVHIPEELTEANLLDALRNGQSFLTNGPILFTELNNQEPDSRYGHEAVLNADGSAILKIDLKSNRYIDYIYIIADGKLLQKIPVNSKTYHEELPLNLAGKTWILVDVWGDRYARALTNPIFLTTNDMKDAMAAKSELIKLIKSAMIANPIVELVGYFTHEQPESIINLRKTLDTIIKPVLFNVKATKTEVDNAIASLKNHL